MSFLIVLLTCFIASPSFAEVLARKPFTDRDLREFLFKDYDKLVRPVAQPNDSVNVTFDLVPISIRDLDTKNQVLIMDALMMVSWKDFYLKWNPEEFNHIGQLCLPHQEIWKPDLAIYTATPDKALFPASNAQVIVLPCGTVTWLPFVTIRSRCPMRKRPMKGHVECSIKIGSWVYSGRFVSINLKRKEVDLTEFEDTNPDWTLANMKLINESRFHLLDKVYEEYPSFTFNVTLKPRW